MHFEKIRLSLIKRPLGYTLAGFLLVFFICGFFKSPIKIYISIVSAFIFAVFICFALILKHLDDLNKFRTLTVCAFMILSISLASLFSYMNFDRRIGDLSERYDGKSCEVLLRVRSAEKRSDFYSAHYVDILEINREKVNIEAQLTSSYINSYDNGDILYLKADVRINDMLSDSSERYMISKGVLAEVISENEEDVEYRGNKCVFPDSALYNVRRNISYILHENTDGIGTSLSKALIYGERSALPYLFTDSFRELGVSHMLAISGMHFSVIVGMLAMLLSGLRTNKKISILLLSLFVLLYAFIAGFSPSVTRSAFMLLLSYVSLLLSRRSDSVTTLMIAAFVIYMFSPYALYDVGMQLSFFATLGIVTVALPINEKMKCSAVGRIKIIYPLLSALNITLAAILFTTPISFIYFGSVSVISPVINLIFTPFITLLLYLIPLCIILSPLKFISYALGYLINLLSKALEWMSCFIADSADFSIDIRYKICTVLLVLTVISIFLIILLVKDFSKKREALYIPLVAFMIFSYVGTQLATLPQKNRVSICYYTDKTSDAIILIDKGEGILCDSSEGYYGFISDAIDHAESLTNTEITTYMISDYHYPHIATVTKLLEHTSIREFVLPYPPERDAGYHISISEFLIKNGCKVKFYTPQKDVVNFKDITIEVSVYEQTTANPASVIKLGYRHSSERYAYVSNARDLAERNAKFFSELRYISSSYENIILGAHGDCEGIADIFDRSGVRKIKDKPFYAEFNSKE